MRSTLQLLRRLQLFRASVFGGETADPDEQIRRNMRLDDLEMRAGESFTERALRAQTPVPEHREK